MMDGIAWILACLVVASLLVITRYRYVPIVTRLIHPRAHVRVDGDGVIKRISGGGYELRAITALARFIGDISPGSPFVLLSSGGFVDLLLLDKDEARRDEMLDALRNAAPGVSWRDVDKDRMRRRL